MEKHSCIDTKKRQRHQIVFDMFTSTNTTRTPYQNYCANNNQLFLDQLRTTPPGRVCFVEEHLSPAGFSITTTLIDDQATSNLNLLSQTSSIFKSAAEMIYERGKVSGVRK